QPTKFLAARRIAAALGYVALSHLDNVVVDAPGASDSPKSKVDKPTMDDGRWTMATQSSTVHRPSSAGMDFGPGRNQKVIRGQAESGELFRYLQELRTDAVASFDGVLAGWSARRGRGRIAVIISDLLLDGY